MSRGSGGRSFNCLMQNLAKLCEFVHNKSTTIYPNSINIFNCRYNVLVKSICCSFFTWFGHDFPAGQFLSVRSYLIAATTRYSGFFQLSLVTRFACDIGQLARIWIWVSSEVITILVSTLFFL